MTRFTDQKTRVPTTGGRKGGPERSPGPDYDVYVLLGSITICRCHKLTVSDHSQGTLQVRVSQSF